MDYLQMAKDCEHILTMIDEVLSRRSRQLKDPKMSDAKVEFLQASIHQWKLLRQERVEALKYCRSKVVK